VKLALLLALELLLASTAVADPLQVPDGVRFEPHAGQILPLASPVVDERGESLPLASFLGRRPAVLVLGYYACPNLCSTTLNTLAQGLAHTGLAAGRDYEVLELSIAPEEDASLAARKKADYAASFGTPVARGWHFLTGPPQSIAAIARAVGFRYRYDAAARQYIHPAGFVLVTPQGRIARYYLGASFTPADIREGLLAARAGESRSLVEGLLLYCLHVDPTTGRYTLRVMNLLRIFSAAIALGLLALVLRQSRSIRFPRRSREGGNPASRRVAGSPPSRGRPKDA
jgi:protein SCO1/2